MVFIYDEKKLYYTKISQYNFWVIPLTCKHEIII